MPSVFNKDPESVLDYAINWATWLGEDTIATSSWSANRVTIDSDTNDTDSATVWVSGGTENSTATITNTITTAGGRTVERTITLIITDK